MFKKETEEFLKQHAAKEGPLYEKWLKVRSAKIREDIEKRKAFKPERVKV